MSTFQLGFIRNRWVLSMPSSYEPQVSYSLEVRYEWDGETWNHYRLVEWDMGEEREMITREQLDEKVKVYEEHEGIEPPVEWFDRYVVILPEHEAFELIRRWEAMLALDLFTPSVTF